MGVFWEGEEVGIRHREVWYCKDKTGVFELMYNDLILSKVNLNVYIYVHILIENIN